MTLHTIIFILLSVVTTKPLEQVEMAFSGMEYGTATVFWAQGDAYNPDNRNACYRRAAGITERLHDEDMVIAHKTLPCGAKVLLWNPRTGKYAVARKADWGPVGAMVDLSKAVQQKLQHNGKEPVVLLPMDPVLGLFR